MKQDTLIRPHLVGLAAVATEEQRVTHGERGAELRPHPGVSVAFDLGDDLEDCAQGWVNLVTAYPTQDFPEPAAGYIGCPSGVYALTIDVGVVRCISADEVPDPDVLQPALDTQLADMASLRRAICRYASENDLQVTFDGYLGYGPEGGAVGGWWTIRMSSS